MKKLTNPVFLQTTAYQLSEEDASLLNLEMAEIKESASPSAKTLSVRFNAIHAGTTRNNHTFLLEELEESATRWTKPFGKPILKNHNTLEEPLGRVREANVIHFSDNDGVLQLVASISDQDAIQKIHDERYLTVSVGVMASRVECSICGVNWFEEECDHSIGREYQIEGSNSSKICTALVKEIEPIELSFVNSPADANDERYAGIVHFGESNEIEFYADSDEGVTTKGKKKKSGVQLPDNIALALKESYQEFLSLLATEGEEQTQMDEEETKTQTDSVEESIADATNDSGTNDGVSEEGTSEETVISEEVNETEETETTVEETVVEESEDDIASLNEYLTPEETTASEVSEESEEEVVVEDNTNETLIAELQNRVQELEAEKATLLNSQEEQQNAVAEWVKVARQILSRHIADLKTVLEKADGKEIDTLEAELATNTLKSLSTELSELRKEFKSKDFSVENPLASPGALNNESLSEDTTISTKSEEVKKESFSEKELINSLTSLLSPKRTL